MKAILNNEEPAEILMRDDRSSGARVSLEFLYGIHCFGINNLIYIASIIYRLFTPYQYGNNTGMQQ